MPPKAGFIYAIGAANGVGPVKIGWSNNPDARVATIQVGHHQDLVVMGRVPATRPEESATHHRLRRSRIRGEWFERTPEVVQEVDQIMGYCGTVTATGELLPPPQPQQVHILRDAEGRPSMAVVPWKEFESLMERYERAQRMKAEASLIAAGNAARGEESFPADVARRLIAGEIPLKVFREWRDMTQEELASTADVAAGYLSQIESGARNMGKKVAEKLSPVLNVSVAALMDL